MSDPKFDGLKMSTRTMKIHKKSRGGCGNCKIRKVKCDENKPMCNRCGLYGTFCNYDPQYSDLQPLEQGSNGFLVLQPSAFLEDSPVFGSIGPHTSLKQRFSPAFFAGEYEFTSWDLELLHRFETRTIYTMGCGRNQNIYRSAFKTLARSHPSLFHIVLTVTMMHDRYLSIGVGPEQSAAIAFHWSQGAALMNRKLSSTIELPERDALWACAGMLGLLAFSSFEAEAPEESWPLRDSPTDLQWLKLCEGKKEIWKIVNPLREDSVFRDLVPNFLGEPTSCSDPVLRKLPLPLMKLCRLDDIALRSNNPYLAPACFLAQTGDLVCDGQNAALFLSFFGRIDNDYKELLHRKDPLALLLFAYWQAKMCQYRQWWVWCRAFLECQSICQYLRLYHSDDENILEALSFPETICAAQSVMGMPI